MYWFIDHIPSHLSWGTTKNPLVLLTWSLLLSFTFSSRLARIRESLNSPDIELIPGDPGWKVIAPIVWKGMRGSLIVWAVGVTCMVMWILFYGKGAFLLDEKRGFLDAIQYSTDSFLRLRFVIDIICGQITWLLLIVVICTHLAPIVNYRVIPTGCIAVILAPVVQYLLHIPGNPRKIPDDKNFYPYGRTGIVADLSVPEYKWELWLVYYYQILPVMILSIVYFLYIRYRGLSWWRVCREEPD